VTPEEKREHNRLATARYVASHREQVRKRARAAYWADPEKERLRGARYRAANPEKIDKDNREYYASHREQEYSRSREYRLAHPEWSREMRRKWRRDNPEKAREANLKGGAKYRAAHAEEIPKYAREWYAKHLDDYRVRYITYAANRRAHAKGAGGRFSPADVAALLESQGGKCAACATAFSTTGKHRFERDHIVALSRGGSNQLSNIQLLCRPCNRSKFNRDFLEWLQKKRA
jgi:5-methylcytosine-specific restriction endonuclease McrA